MVDHIMDTLEFPESKQLFAEVSLYQTMAIEKTAQLKVVGKRLCEKYETKEKLQENVVFPKKSGSEELQKMILYSFGSTDRSIVEEYEKNKGDQTDRQVDVKSQRKRIMARVMRQYNKICDAAYAPMCLECDEEHAVKTDCICAKMNICYDCATTHFKTDTCITWSDDLVPRILYRVNKCPKCCMPIRIIKDSYGILHNVVADQSDPEEIADLIITRQNFIANNEVQVAEDGGDNEVQVAEDSGDNEVQVAEDSGDNEVQVAEDGGDNEVQVAEDGGDNEVQVAEDGGDYEVQVAEDGGDYEVQVAEDGGDNEVQVAEDGGDDEVQVAEDGGDNEVQFAEDGGDNEVQFAEDGDDDDEDHDETYVAPRSSKKRTIDERYVARKQRSRTNNPAPSPENPGHLPRASSISATPSPENSGHLPRASSISATPSPENSGHVPRASSISATPSPEYSGHLSRASSISATPSPENSGHLSRASSISATPSPENSGHLPRASSISATPSPENSGHLPRASSISATPSPEPNKWKVGYLRLKAKNRQMHADELEWKAEKSDWTDKWEAKKSEWKAEWEAKKLEWEAEKLEMANENTRLRELLHMQ